MNTHRTIVLLTLIVVAIVLLGGVLAGHQGTSPAYAAACKAANGACGGGDGTRTSAVTVQHVYDPSSTNQAVEPNTGETWNIDVYWNSATGACGEHVETASVDADWDTVTDSWVLSNVTLTTNIIGITVCQLSNLSCSFVTEGHSYGYKLIVDINDPVAVLFVPHNLRQAVYTTTSVDDGNLISLGACTLGAGQTVNSQTWTATDAGAGAGGFECAFNCNAVGPTITLEY